MRISAIGIAWNDIYLRTRLWLRVISRLGIFTILRWKMHLWLPDYVARLAAAAPSCSGVRHVMFVFVDHYEPGSGERGAEINRKWLENYRFLADRHRDSYGRKPQHTWFYPYDQQNDAVMPDLVQAVGDGYGEIEFHLHHSHDTDSSFTQKMGRGLKWFNSYGAMIDEKGRVAFGFVHGNWSLDNSRGAKFCGVARELEILKKCGCYADFTFPAFGEKAQPRKVNSIYYARQGATCKSYDRGADACVGKLNHEDLMIFQGPLNLDDYGAVESFNLPTPRKIDSWIESDIHVKGRPEWVFVKVHTHGTQSGRIFVSEVDEMLSHLEARYAAGDFRLHYVTAREAYNIVIAAEDGKTGDPDTYLDYAIAPPLNRTVGFTHITG